MEGIKKGGNTGRRKEGQINRAFNLRYERMNKFINYLRGRSINFQAINSAMIITAVNFN